MEPLHQTSKYIKLYKLLKPQKHLIVVVQFIKIVQLNAYATFILS